MKETYTVLGAYGVEELTAKVNAYKAMGWKTKGWAMPVNATISTFLIQTMELPDDTGREDKEES